jgi:hypothetical protein
MKSLMRKKLEKILNKINLGQCNWCHIIIKKKLDNGLRLPFRCSECETKRLELLNEELQLESQEERYAEIEDFSNDYD